MLVPQYEPSAITLSESGGSSPFTVAGAVKITELITLGVEDSSSFGVPFCGVSVNFKFAWATVGGYMRVLLAGSLDGSQEDTKTPFAAAGTDTILPSFKTPTLASGSTYYLTRTWTIWDGLCPYFQFILINNLGSVTTTITARRFRWMEAGG